MEAKFTYELSVAFTGEEQSRVKSAVKDWLNSRGVDSFVEGVVDDLDIDHEEPDLRRDFYEELGGEECPLSVYSYDPEYLGDLETRLRSNFGAQVECRQKSMETRVWLEGWKSSFRPIETCSFYIYPPWEKKPDSGDLIPVLIDPGMAFGTGQHATTKICLHAMEELFVLNGKPGERLLDVGAGSGILSIAALKAGFGQVDACDIDPNAVIACKNNGDANSVSINIRSGSVSGEEPATAYDCVVANILYVVLKDIIHELAIHVKPGGHLILSGILEEQKEAMLKAAEAEGLQLTDEKNLQDWVCLCLARP